MKVTVCELSNEPVGFERDWQGLVSHVKAEASDLVLLPEMPFYTWPAWSKQKDNNTWKASVEAHDQWMPRLAEFAPAAVVGTRPVIKDSRFFNEGFIWEPASGYHSAHVKYYLPNEEGFWEANWYERGNEEFSLYQVNQIKIGFLICTELWFNAHARDYARQGIHLLVCPRATPGSTVDKWIAGGRTAAVVSGAFSFRDFLDINDTSFEAQNRPEVDHVHIAELKLRVNAEDRHTGANHVQKGIGVLEQSKARRRMLFSQTDSFGFERPAKPIEAT